MDSRRRGPLSHGRDESPSLLINQSSKRSLGNSFLISILPLLLLIVVPGASSALWQWNGSGSAPRKIKPRVTRPSGPTNVTLDVVSRSELGVSWEPPLFDGGRAVTKYLVEWDTDRLMTSGIASPSNPYANGVDGPLVRSEVVSGGRTDYRISGLEEGREYYVRVSAYGDGYSNAISTDPPHAKPTGTIPGYLTDVSLSIATDSDVPDRLRLAWSAPEEDVNGFSVLPAGCAGGESPPSAPDDVEAYRVMWDTHPSMENASVYDVPAVTGDGSPLRCCPSQVDDEGTCAVELGAEVQSIAIRYDSSTVPSGGEPFEGGAIRVAYVGTRSRSIRVVEPARGSTQVRVDPSASPQGTSPLSAGDLIRMGGGVHVVSDASGWPASVELSSGYAPASASSGGAGSVVRAYFATPPGSCFDVSGGGNSAEGFRSHVALGFEDSPFDESVTVSRSSLTEPFHDGGGSRVVGYKYRVTFSGQGFSSTLGGSVEEFLIISDPSSPLSSAGGYDCGDPFVSNGEDVSSQVSVKASTEMESGSIAPGLRYFVRIAGVNANGEGPFVTAAPESAVPMSRPGLARDCRVYAVPDASSSLRVEWDGVRPYHGQAPSSYRVDFYDVDSGSLVPEVSKFLADVDERSHYSITNNDLIPGRRYKVLVVPANDLGEGGPGWFGDFDPVGLSDDYDHDEFGAPQDYLEGSCHAHPTCESGSVECSEADAENFFIVARSLPPPPRVEAGTYPAVSTGNRFSLDSTLVTFESPLTVPEVGSSGMPTDKFLVEWSTESSFPPGADSLWSSEVVAQYSDVTGEEDAIGELLIDSLEMGTTYYVRVSAHSTAGYGAPSMGVPVKPMTRPDPPFEPILSGLTTDRLLIASSRIGGGLSDSAVAGTSLLVSWRPPRVDDGNERPDLVGDGGETVSSYLVEWSRTSWDSYSPSVFEVSLETSLGVSGSAALGLLSGSFRASIDTSASSEAAVSGTFVSATIPVDVSDNTLKTILENVPNVGEVEISSPEPLRWRITFLTELGDMDLSLAENNLIDDSMAAGDIDITKVGVGAIPTNSAYGFEILSGLDELVTDEDGSINYVIEHLVPGLRVFVRVSAGNQVGFGPRRRTAPQFSAPALQRPDAPTSLYSDDAPPYLSIHSPTALEVHIGPPFYDGGSPLSSFLIEWDTSPHFHSSPSGDGSPLASARADAASRICDWCVSGFDLETNTFAYAGDEDITKLLIPQRKIIVYFDDDGESYTFSITSATPSAITVSGEHLRVSSLEDMRGRDGGLGSDLDLLGATFVINDLDAGTPYFVRVSSENGVMGTGRSVETAPSKETPRGFPLPPSSVLASVIDKNALGVSWSDDARLNDPGILGYKIERYRKSGAASTPSSSFFGEQEVVELSTSGLGLAGGTFHLYFGVLGEPSNILLSSAKASHGLGYIETQVDLSPLLHRGEAVLIGGDQHFVHETDPFTSTSLPLSETYSGNDAKAISVFGRSKSMPIPYDATAEELQNALERMPNVNSVAVRREIDGANNGYQWFVTFLSNVGPQPEFFADTTNLIGSNPLGFSITRTIVGMLPDDYDATIIDDPTVTSLDMKNLLTGEPYYIQVSSITDKGESLPMLSFPTPLAPGGVPGNVPSPGIRPFDERTLLVTFEAAAEPNGAPVEEYVVEASSDPSFSEASTATIRPDHRVQRITTRAHTIPWDDTSSFTLSLGDFHGDFTVPVGAGTTTVRVQNGDNVLERSTGAVSLSSHVARGEFLSIGGIEFRVCLSDSYPHDDSHLSLCSRDNALEVANFYAEGHLDVIDELPIFILDTSLGAAKSPAIGDIFLSSVDAHGSSRDTRNRLRRGDLIRVGHPDLGETFRISTDIRRDFTDQVIPLGSRDDANTPASLSAYSLEHSTYEVQSFYLRSSTDSVTLTPSNILSSGFRIRYKSEPTRRSTGGGADGCLKWDSDANGIKEELETLDGIGSVEVNREDLPAIPGGLGAGVKYLVTFTGVRGNVPPLQIVDVASNGCLDAHSLGGKFSQDIAPIVVEQVETPYVPFYEIQTTVDIPYDATSADMKAALVSLSQVCAVDVSRKINRHGYSWDVTFVNGADGSSYLPLLPLSANGANLSADVDPGVSVVDIQNVQMTTETGGTPYFVRVAARNSFGMGPFTLSNPRAVEVSPQAPSEPVDVFAEAISDTEILVQWNPSLEDGGRSITHYKVEYDELSTFTGGLNGGPFGSLSLSSSSISTVSDVQSVTVKIDDEGLINDEVYLSGSFSLSFDGQKSGQLPYNASPDEVKHALEGLCNIQEVYVTRSIHCSPDPSIGCMTPDGYTWLVTFVSLKLGDQHHRHTSILSSSTSHRLSVDGSYLFQCSDVARATCTIGGSSSANVGTVQEVQTITVASSHFSVTIMGETSDIINIGDSISVAEEKLNSYTVNGVGTVLLTCADCVGDVINPGDSISLYFSSYRGDLPPVIVSDPAATVTETTKGHSQYVVGRASYSLVIPGLTSVHDWYVRVFAYNGIGEGPPEPAWPSPLRLSAVAPQVPENVDVGVQGATALQVSWNSPSSIGGAEIASFIIEYDTSPAFATRNGMPLGQLVALEGDADASIGVVSDSFPGSSDPILRKRIMMEDVDAISNGIIGLGSILVIDGHHLTVSSINLDGCGVTCLAMETDYTGSQTSGMKVYTGPNPRQYVFPITSLNPGTAYFVRVAAVNEKAQSPFTFSAVSSTPMDVPTAISWASISAISKDVLRIDYAPPSSSERPYGANGSPPSNYHIEVAKGANEIQELQIVSAAELQVGAFGLVFGGEETGCIDIGASADTMKQALENLSNVDGVAVTMPSQSNSLLLYNVTFNGPSSAKKDQPLLEIDYSAACTQLLDGSGTELNVRTLQNGAQVFIPDIVSLSTKADAAVSGYFELSLGYQGDYDMLVSLASEPAQFRVDPGSRWVDTMGDDLSSVLHPGELIVIGSEQVEVQSVSSDQLELKEYHIRGTGGVAEPGYREDNYIGSGTISSGDSLVTEDSGRNLESVIRQGEVIELRDGTGGKDYVTVTSISGSSISFSPHFTGSTAKYLLYAKKKLILPANSSSDAMKMSLESLRDVGSVEVTRDGPNPFEGFTWYITFTSNMGATSCSRPSWCFASSIESANYITISGLGQMYDGNYVQTSFNGGRPVHQLLGKSCYVLYDLTSFEWRLLSGDNSVISSVASTAVSVPLSGWSNGANVAPPVGAAPLLLGQNAVADASLLQNEVQQSFENIVFSTEMAAGQHEIQEVELLSEADDLSGSFQLSMGDTPQRIIMYADDSAEDFATKLQSLSTIGHVTVDFTMPFDKFGRVWLITFSTNYGDMPLLRHHGTSNLQGTSVSLSVRERVKGDFGAHHLSVGNLEEGGIYSVRIKAENEAGFGPSTSKSQNSGSGVQPMARSVSSPPGRPLLKAGTVTKSRAEVELTPPDTNGNEISSYKFEWTSSDTFGPSAQATVRLSCSDESEMLGFYRFTHGHSHHETSVPIDIRSNSTEVLQIVNMFELLNEVEITTETNELSELEMTLTFYYDVGPIGSLTLDTENLRCQSEQEAVESSIIMTTIGSEPADYGSKEIFVDSEECGSIFLGESSASQYLILTANFNTVTGGSYKLMQGGESSGCISFDASDLDMKAAIQSFEAVREVDVIATAAPHKSHFPYEYEVVFEGNYAYGDWPSLQINPFHFGAGECDPFVGGTGHRASILPIRDESLCLDGADHTIAIVADSITPIGGTFTVSFGHGSAVSVNSDASASEMEEHLMKIIDSNHVHVTKHNHDDMGEGVAWAVTYPGSVGNNNQLRIVDTFVRGQNAKVNAYPILTIKTYSRENDMSGDFRIQIDGELTAPLSHQSSRKKILQEMHRLNGIGKVNMLGPPEGDVLSFLEFNALIDDSFTSQGLKAISVVGDLTSTLVQGDPLIVGTCELEINGISHEGYDETQSAGYIFESIYPASPETSKAKLLGYTILQIKPGDEVLSFAADCSQGDGVSESVQVGSVLSTGTGVDHSMIIKSYIADLDTVKVIPGRNWRGTAPRIFFKPPSGLPPHTFDLTGLNDQEFVIRASAKNNQGFGVPSDSLKIQPISTVPSAPTSVLLF